MRTHLPYLDGWRGIAIVLVLLHHFAGYEAGDVGVQVFFVLSGMLMSQVLFVEKVPLRVFYRRRVARVFPVFFLYLLVIAIAFLAFRPAQPIGELVYSALFLRTYLPGQSIWDKVLPVGHLWSLNVEEHSYVILSAVALFATARGMVVAKVALPLLTIACLVAYALYSAHPPGPEASPAMLRTECAAFSLMLSAALHLLIQPGSVRLFWSALAVTVLLMAAEEIGGLHSNPIRLVLLPAALAVLVNTLDAAPKAVHDLLSAAWLRWFGVVSFSLYVWQQGFMWLSMRGHLSQSQACLMAILIGAISYYYFEAPMRGWIRSRQSRPLRPSDVPAGT